MRASAAMAVTAAARIAFFWRWPSDQRPGKLLLTSFSASMRSKAELSAAVTAATKVAYEREVETATAIAWAVRAATILGFGSSRARTIPITAVEAAALTVELGPVMS